MITQTRKLYEFCVFMNDDFSRILEALTYTDISLKNRARILRLTSPFLYRMKNGQVIGVMNSINDTIKTAMPLQHIQLQRNQLLTNMQPSGKIQLIHGSMRH